MRPDTPTTQRSAESKSYWSPLGLRARMVAAAGTTTQRRSNSIATKSEHEPRACCHLVLAGRSAIAGANLHQAVVKAACSATVLETTMPRNSYRMESGMRKKGSKDLYPDDSTTVEAQSPETDISKQLIIIHRTCWASHGLSLAPPFPTSVGASSRWC